MIKRLESIKKWYNNNLGRMVLLFFVVIFFTTSVAYIPYFNIILRSSVGIVISLITFYLLFPPPTKILASIFIVVLFLSYIFVILKLNFALDSIGGLLFFLLVLMFINYIKDTYKKERA